MRKERRKRSFMRMMDEFWEEPGTHLVTFFGRFLVLIIVIVLSTYLLQSGSVVKAAKLAWGDLVVNAEKVLGAFTGKRNPT